MRSTTSDFLAAVRVDELNDGGDGQKLKLFLDVYSVYVVYEEKGEVTGKLHYQGYVACGDKDRYNEIKQVFKNTYVGRKPASQSFTQVKKVESYMRYVAKDKKIFCHKGVSEQDIAKREAESYKKTKDGGSLVCRCLDAMRQYDLSYMKDNEEAVRRYVGGWLVDEYVKELKPINIFYLRTVINTVTVALIGRDQSDIVEKLIERW